ncbi:hypothetical protein Ait01nite_089210 [Actinoplanes italicus]|uniref:Flavin reductase n=1 Tax=Actinoplanes italicus TaxID=113567 RepID=A0A2T0JI67_9ACTN|nr:hypothetical protein CLV67_14212 [Actinoplanes italicus]GIE35876.1 hypothetical protein Ait01nite_089210 [Actinoplanes italicus]
MTARPGPLYPWHIPDMATYDCRRCGEPWPCEDARLDLIELWAPAELDLRMTAEMRLAAPVLPDVPLEPRFLGWIRQLREG